MADSNHSEQDLPTSDGAPPSHVEGTLELQEEVQQDSSKVATEPRLPRLQRPHRRRKIRLTVGIALITLDVCVLPITYFYALKFGTSLGLQDIFAVITGVYGLLSFTHYFFRSLRLFLSKKAVKYMPLGWNRWGMLEFLHVNIAIIITLVEIELVAATAPNNPIVRLCAMPAPTICFYCGFLFITTAILTMIQKPIPFSMSSTPKGTPWRPAIVGIIEDFGALEMNGQRAFRAQLISRYEVSFMFRRLIMMLSWLWGVGFLVVATGTTIMVMLVEENVAFGLGWVVPFLCSAVMGVLTVLFVTRQLEKEREVWAHKKPDSCASLERGL